MVFEYDNFGAPIGVVYNGTQYFYNTNQFGDVVGILDENGIEIVEYEYTEWWYRGRFPVPPISI